MPGLPRSFYVFGRFRSENQALYREHIEGCSAWLRDVGTRAVAFYVMCGEDATTPFPWLLGDIAHRCRIEGAGLLVHDLSVLGDTWVVDRLLTRLDGAPLWTVAPTKQVLAVDLSVASVAKSRS